MKTPGKFWQWFIFEAFIIANGGVRNFAPVWIVALMCIPGALSS